MDNTVDKITWLSPKPMRLNTCLKLSARPIRVYNPNPYEKMDKKEAARLIIPLGKTH